MHILFISAFYPPYVVGGWEQLVRDINTRLQARGHTTHVLTSRYGVEPAQLPEPGVERSLSLESDLVSYKPLDFFFLHRQQLESNLTVARQSITRFNPDVIFIHVMWNLSRGIAWLAEQLCPGRVVYYIANDWPYAPNTHQAYWQDPAKLGWRQPVKQLLAPFALRALDQEMDRFPLQFEKVMCVSQAVRRDLASHAGIPLENMRVVYNGVETDLFTPAGLDKNKPSPGLSLLYAGSLVPHKGVHTAVEAMALLAQRPEIDALRLSIAGSGHPAYEAYLKKLVAQKGLGDRVQFLARVSRAEMPSLLRKFDVLVFPSTWDEPLSRMMQEAMSAGLVVVGTPTGGTPEILLEGETGLIFEPGNAGCLAARLEQLAGDSSLRSLLARNARQVVLERFDLGRMIDEIEAYLEQVVSRSQPEEAHTSV